MEREGAGVGSKGGVTLAHACDAFVAEREQRGRSGSTLRYYGCKVAAITETLGGGTPLNSIDARAVQEYIRARRAVRFGKKKDRELSSHTIAKELGVLRSVLRMAKRLDMFHADPAKVLPDDWSTGYQPKRRALSRAEADALLARLARPRAAQVAFIVATGARWSEAERARRSDIKLPCNLVELRGTKTGLAERVVPILPHVRDLVQLAHRASRRKGPAFPRWPNVRRDLATACRLVDIEHCSPNDLRRTASMWLVQAGAPSNLVGQFMGHADGRMVERVYGRLEPEQLGQALATVTDVCQPVAASKGQKDSGRSGTPAKTS
jgi:integrase